jgi:FkbM family methyltransferase
MRKRLLDAVAAAAAGLLGSDRLSGLNAALLKLGLRARGYHDWSGSGERWFATTVLPRWNPKVCIDVGANVGDYAEMLLQSTSAEVHCFEPQPAVFDRLSARLAPYGPRVVAVPSGVGAQAGRLTLHYSESASELASFRPEVNAIDYVRNDQRVEVDVLRLDDYVRGAGLTRVDFLKIDTEGYELEVLEGAQDLIRDLRPTAVQLEFNLHHMLRGVSLYTLAQLLPDYEVYQLKPGGWARRDPMDPLANVYRHSNFVFVRRGVPVA